MPPHPMLGRLRDWAVFCNQWRAQLSLPLPSPWDNGRLTVVWGPETEPGDRHQGCGGTRTGPGFQCRRMWVERGRKGSEYPLQRPCLATASGWGLGLGTLLCGSHSRASPPPPLPPNSQPRKGQTRAGGGERPGKLGECLLWTHRSIPSPPGPRPTDMAHPVWAGSEVSSPGGAGPDGREGLLLSQLS